MVLCGINPVLLEESRSWISLSWFGLWVSSAPQKDSLGAYYELRKRVKSVWCAKQTLPARDTHYLGKGHIFRTTPLTELARKYKGTMYLPVLRAALQTTSVFTVNHSPLRSFQCTKNQKHTPLNIYKWGSPSRFLCSSHFQRWLSKWPALPAGWFPAHPSARFVQTKASLLLAWWYWLLSATCRVTAVPCRVFAVKMSHRKNPAGYLEAHLGLRISRIWDTL